MGAYNYIYPSSNPRNHRRRFERAQRKNAEERLRAWGYEKGADGIWRMDKGGKVLQVDPKKVIAQALRL